MVVNPAFLGRTSIRNFHDYQSSLGYVPVINGAAQLYLSTYNPKSVPPNSSFLGAQIGTIEKWGISEHRGVAFEANVLSPIGIPGGAVTALFAYNLLSAHPFLHDEIDFEFASNSWSGANEAINTNVYIASNNGIDKVVQTGVDFSNPITFRIEWIRSGIRWFINGIPTQRNPGCRKAT